jgi:hypothetical protein
LVVTMDFPSARMTRSPSACRSFFALSCDVGKRFPQSKISGTVSLFAGNHPLGQVGQPFVRPSYVHRKATECDQDRDLAEHDDGKRARWSRHTT